MLESSFTIAYWFPPCFWLLLCWLYPISGKKIVFANFTLLPLIWILNNFVFFFDNSGCALIYNRLLNSHLEQIIIEKRISSVFLFSQPFSRKTSTFWIPQFFELFYRSFESSKNWYTTVPVLIKHTVFYKKNGQKCIIRNRY